MICHLFQYSLVEREENGWLKFSLSRIPIISAISAAKQLLVSSNKACSSEASSLFSASVSSDKVIELPAVGKYYDNVTLTWTVTDETGAPMIGLTVIVTGTSNGATTDIDGRYLLEVPENGTLTFSYLGYETVVIPLDGRTQIGRSRCHLRGIGQE